MKKIILLVIAMVVMTLSMATGASATEQSTALPANGVTSITQNGDNFTINLASADASEVKYIKPGNTVLCSEHDGKPKNGHPLCDKTSYTITSTADCVMFQVDWTDNKHNSSDPVKCRDKTPEPPADDTDTKKVTLCHATGSDKNPFTKITVSVNAFFNSGHIDHDGDIYPAFTYVKKGDTLSVSAKGDQSLLQYDDCVKPVVPPVDKEIPVPATPQVEDPCGPGNAKWIKPADTNEVAYTLTNGPLGEQTLQANAKDGYVFPNKEKVKGFGNAPETNLDACPVVVPPKPNPKIEFKTNVIPPVCTDENPVTRTEILSRESQPVLDVKSNVWVDGPFTDWIVVLSEDVPATVKECPEVIVPPVKPPVTPEPPKVTTPVEPSEPEGEISTPISEEVEEPVYKEKAYSALPNTGGTELWYVLAGLALVAVGTTVVLRLSKTKNI
jgi:LPXTG-motif cell wall-anchored protein